MALKDELFALCNKLAQNGWREMILSVTNNQLDIKQSSSEKLKDSLLETINQIDRDFFGFEDYTHEENKGISPRKPASSLLYHALASPNVLWKDKQKHQKLSYFPSIDEIELVENFVFGINPPSLSFLLSEAGNSEIGIVVFSSQYRTAIDTPHQKHADLVFSRTGISRVGTADFFYNDATRSFISLVENEPNKLRVLPSKYNAYISINLKGDESFLGKNIRKDTSLDPTENIPLDSQLDFWIPVQKLFNGNECIDNKVLNLTFETKHKNEKIKRIHQFIKKEFSIETGQSTATLEQEPFLVEKNIAEFDVSRNLLIPTTHKKLVDEAISENMKVSLSKPKFPFDNINRRWQIEKNRNTLSDFSSSLEIRSNRADDSRKAPEYMHIRTKVENNQNTIDLNSKKEVVTEVFSTNYNALHYVDFTGDGFIKVLVSGISEIKKNIIAYSIVAAPDFFPHVEQSEILSKTLKDLGAIWSTPPLTLSNTRFSPNINSHPEFNLSNGINPFDTITALISIKKTNRLSTKFKDNSKENRISYLTDGAAGIFAPGWDTSFDVSIFGGKAIPHLAAYGLGSPFPEDSKLCAALSSFWPAVAPDISRSFWPTSNTILPLTDEEIGANSQKSGWDGELGPQYDEVTKKVVFKKDAYVDYTLNAFESKFDFHLLSRIDSEDYLSRVRKYFQIRKIDQQVERVLPNGRRTKELELVSFTKVGVDDSVVSQANSILANQLIEPILKFVFILPSQSIKEKPIGIDKIEVSVSDEVIYLIDFNDKIAKKTTKTGWQLVTNLIS